VGHGATFEEAHAEAGGGVLHLNDANTDQFIFSAQQPYHTFLLLTAHGGRCDLCGVYESEFAVLAASYAKVKAEGGEAVPNMLFAVVYEPTVATLAQKLGVRGVPTLIHYNPTKGKAHPQRPVPASQRFPGADDVTAEALANFVAGPTGYRVEIYRSPWPAIFVLLTLLGIASSIVYFFFERVVDLALWVRDQKWIWLMGCLGVYLIAVSGVLFDIIRGVPMFGYDPATRRPIVWANQSNMQYGAEGAIIGFLNFVCATSVILAVKWLPRWKDSGNKDMAILAAVGIFFFFYGLVVNRYKFKSPWYRPTPFV
jgi:hypothetical protein